MQTFPSFIRVFSLLIFLILSPQLFIAMVAKKRREDEKSQENIRCGYFWIKRSTVLFVVDLLLLVVSLLFSFGFLYFPLFLGIFTPNISVSLTTREIVSVLFITFFNSLVKNLKNMKKSEKNEKEKWNLSLGRASEIIGNFHGKNQERNNPKKIHHFFFFLSLLLIKKQPKYCYIKHFIRRHKFCCS